MPGDNDLLRHALESITPLERRLWGGSIRRGLAGQRTRLLLFIPKYGVRGATRAVVAQLWLLPAVAGPLSALVLGPTNPGPVRVGVGYALLGVFVIALVASMLRAISAVVAIREHRRGAEG